MALRRKLPQVDPTGMKCYKIRVNITNILLVLLELRRPGDQTLTCRKGIPSHASGGPILDFKSQYRNAVLLFVSNHEAITCLGIVFNGGINTLVENLEKDCKLSDLQGAYRNQSVTVDHICILKSLISKYIESQKKCTAILLILKKSIRYLTRGLCC